MQLAVGDLNGDGFPDIAIAYTAAPANPAATDGTGGSVAVFYGDPTAVSNSTPLIISGTTYTLSNHPVGIIIADANGDTLKDILTTGFSYVQDAGTTQVWSFVNVLVNNGDSATAPTFDTSHNFFYDLANTSVEPVSDLRIADMDGDGNANDVVVADSNQSQFYILGLPSNLDPNSIVKTTFATPAGAQSLELPDLNGDGHPDVVITHSGSNGLTVALNTTLSGQATVAFKTATDTETANGGQFIAPVVRGAGSTAAMDVALNFGGTAVSGSDYVVTSPTNGELHFAESGSESDIVITTASNIAASRTITIGLGNITPSGAGTVGTTSTTTITLNPQPVIDKTVHFELASYTVAPDGNTDFFNVIRGANSTGAIDVPITVGGTAIPFNPSHPLANCDYNQDFPSPTVNSIHFTASQFSQQVALSISGNPSLRTPKTVIVTLGTPTGDATLATPKTATITISNGPVNVRGANALAVKPGSPLPVTSTDKFAHVKIVGSNFSPWTFTTTQTLDASAPGLALKVQYAVESQPSTIPADGDFLDLTNGAMTKGGGKSTTWSVTVNRLPVGPTGGFIFFRTMTAATGEGTKAGHATGPIRVMPGPRLVLIGTQCISTSATDPSNFTTTSLVTHDSESITYRFNYINSGDGPATNCVLSIPISPLVHLATFNQPVLGGQVGGLDNKGHVTTNLGSTAALQCNISTLLPNASDSFEVVITVDSANEFNPNDSTFSFGRLISTPAYNIATKTQKQQVYGNPLVATIASPLRMQVNATSGNGGLTKPGAVITYTLTVFNDAAFDMATPAITDIVPIGTSLEAIYDDDGTGNYIGSRITSNPRLPLDHSTPAPGTHYSSSVVNGGSLQLKWTLDEIPAGGSREAKFDARVLYDVPTEVMDGTNGEVTGQIVNNEYNVSGTPPSGGSVPAFTSATPIPPATLEIEDDPNLLPPVLGLSKEVIGQSTVLTPISDAQNPNAPPVMTPLASVAPPDGTADGNGVLTYLLRYKNTGTATAQNVVIHDFINSKTSVNAPINCVFLGLNTVFVTTVTASSTTTVALPSGQITLKDGSGTVIPPSGDSRMTRAIDFSLGDLATDDPTVLDRFISYQVAAENGGTFAPDPLTTAKGGTLTGIIRTGDFYLSTDSFSFPIFAAPRETFALVVKPVTLEIESAAEIPPPPPNYTPGVPPNGDFFYLVEFVNTGDIPASNVAISCPLPKGVLFEGFYSANGTALNPTDPNIGKNGDLNYQDSSPLPAQSGGFLRIKAHLTSDALRTFPAALKNPGASFNFKATITGGYAQGLGPVLVGGPRPQTTLNTLLPADPVISNNSLVRVAQHLAPELWLAKKAPVSVLQGGAMTYTLFFGNTGNADAQNATVAIYVPDNTAIVDHTPDGYSFNKTTHVATWNLGTLAAHNAGAVTLTVKVNQDSGTILENSVVMHAGNALGVLAGRNVTTVSPTNWFGQLHQWWNNLLGGNQINLGAANYAPEVEDDITHLTQDSHYTTIGNASVIFLKNGVFIIPMGSGNVVVGGPSGLITGGVALNNGDSDTLVTGAGSDINIPSIGSLTGNVITPLVLSVVTNNDPTKAGNVLIGGNNLIAPDGKSLLNNDSGQTDGPVTGSSAAGLQRVGGAAVAAGAGNLIGQDGGGLIGNDGSSLIGQDGGGLIGQDGSGIVSHDGGSVVATGDRDVMAQGGKIVSHDGGSVVSNDGGSVVSNDGGSVVSNDGGSLLSEGGAGFIPTNGAP